MAQSDEDREDYLLTLRTLWPQVAQHDGSDPQFWSWAGVLHRLARRTLDAHFFEVLPGPQEAEVLLALEELGENLTRYSGMTRPLVPAYWPRVQAQLNRVLPLVEKSLSR